MRFHRCPYCYWRVSVPLLVAGGHVGDPVIHDDAPFRGHSRTRHPPICKETLQVHKYSGTHRLRQWGYGVFGISLTVITSPLYPLNGTREIGRNVQHSDANQLSILCITAPPWPMESTGTICPMTTPRISYAHRLAKPNPKHSDSLLRCFEDGRAPRSS